MASKLVRDYLIKLSANSDSYIAEIDRAKRTGDNWYKANASGSKRLDSYLRSNQKHLQSLNNQFASMKSMLTGFVGAFAVGFSAKSIITAADDWGQMAARIKMVTESTNEYDLVQKKLMETSQRNAKNISDSQELYVRSASSMKELGYSTKETLDYIDSLSSSLTINAASSQKTESLINAVGKAMVKGKVSALEWNTILEVTPTIATDIARSMGKTETEIKKLGTAGKISSQQLVKALIEAQKTNAALADAMDNTVADGFTKIWNALKGVVGEANQATGVTRNLANSLGFIAENIDYVVGAGTVLVGLGIARYFGDLTTKVGMSTIEIIKSTVADKQKALATREIATANLTAYASEEKKLLSQKQGLIAAQAKITSDKAQILLSSQLVAIEKNLTLVRTNQAAATNTLSVSNQKLAITSNLARGALGLIGGPLGAAMIAGGALFYFAQQANDARDRALNLNGELDKLITGFDNLTKSQLELKKLNIAEEIKNVTEQLKLQSLLVDSLDELTQANAIVSGNKLIDSLAKLGEAYNKTNQLIGGQKKSSQPSSQKEIESIDEVKSSETIRFDNLKKLEDERFNRQKQYNDLVLSLRTSEQVSLDEMRQKTELIKEQAKSESERLDIMTKLSQSHIKDAPSYSYSDSYNGIGSDFLNIAEYENKLNEWYETQRGLQQQFYDERLLSEEEFSASLASIEEKRNKNSEDLQNAYVGATISAFSDVTGNVADMLKEMVGENSKAYKAMFYASKATAIANTIMATEEAAAKALTAGPYAGPILSGVMRGMGYASAGVIAGTALKGMAHDGMDYIPNEGTWLLDKGERVVDSKTNRDLKSFLNDGGKSGVNIVVNNNARNADVSTSVDDDGRVVSIAINEVSRQLATRTGPVSNSLRNNWNVNSKAD